MVTKFYLHAQNVICIALSCCCFIISVSLNSKALNNNIFLVYSWSLDECLSQVS